MGAWLDRAAELGDTASQAPGLAGWLDAIGRRFGPEAAAQAEKALDAARAEGRESERRRVVGWLDHAVRTTDRVDEIFGDDEGAGASIRFAVGNIRQAVESGLPAPGGEGA